jgi:iron(III) transport system permease protein
MRFGLMGRVSPVRVALAGLSAPRASSPGRLGLILVAGVIAAGMLLPLIYLIVRASTTGGAVMAELLLRPQTLVVALNSLVLAGLVTLVSFVISLPLAWLTVCTDLPGRRLWSVLCALPLVFPSYVGSYSLVAMMGPRGMVQGWLEPFGIERLPSIYGLPGAVWALSIFTYPYLFLSIRAGLRNLDPALDEASRSLGFSPWQTFQRVTLPGLRPSIAAGALLVALYVLSDFGAVSMLRYNSFTRAIYVQYLGSFDRSLASLLALMLVGLSLLLLLAAQRVQGHHRLHRAGVGAARRGQLVHLAGWRWLSLAFCSTVVVATLVLPASVVLYWLVRGLLAGESLVPVWAALVNSVRAAALAAGVATLLALPVAYLVVRFPSRYGAAVAGAVYLGNGLPGIVIALSLVFLGANYAPWLYQTLTMLVFAYIVRFLPEAMGTVRAGLLQISPRLEDAARSLGLSRREAIRRVTLPLLQPGIWTGIALVFLSTLKELPATLLLGPAGYGTLATQIWSATAEAFFTRAAAPALILLVVSALSIMLILRQEELGGL